MRDDFLPRPTETRGRPIDRTLEASGAATQAAAPARDITQSPRRGDRHLDQHPVAARGRTTTPHPGGAASCCPWRARTASPSTSFVDAPPTGNPRINLRPIQCADGSTILPLTRRPGGIQAYKFVLPAGRDDAEPDLRTHEGFDWVYVLDGRLRLVLGEDDLVLEPGEAAEFDTRTPHWFAATGSGPVEYLSLVGKHGERAHVRAAGGQVQLGATGA